MLEQLKADYEKVVGMLPADAHVNVEYGAKYGKESSFFPTIGSSEKRYLYVWSKGKLYLQAYVDRPVEDAVNAILKEILEVEEFESFKAQRAAAASNESVALNRN